RIVRAGENTLFPYKENPKNLDIKENSILFLDLGPIFDDFEADIGRTYVLGQDPVKLKLKNDVETAWYEARDYYLNNTEITSAQLYDFCTQLALSKGWEFGGEIAGHLVGKFPHERLEGVPKDTYIHPENHLKLHSSLHGLEETHWIIEIHFVDRNKKIGGFFEQLALADS
ncbi:MAG: M24 family metallopeptidase, partial [Brumimicrobium sp.]